MAITEIPNMDVLRELMAEIPPADGHAALLAAIRKRYPSLDWRIADYDQTFFVPGQQVFDAAGAIVAEDRKAWIQDLLEAAGGDYRAVWNSHRGQGYATVEEEGVIVFAGAAVGERPEDAIEIQIDRIVGAEAKAVFENWPPSEARDLFAPSSREGVDWKPSPRVRYGLRRMNVISRAIGDAEALEHQRRLGVARTHKVLVNEVHLGANVPSSPPIERGVLELDPDYLKRAIRERRFLDDWAASSCGDVSILRHWAFDVSDYAYKGERHLSVTPRPLTWPNKIEWQDGRSIYQLMDLLERFDVQAGYPMAWFFHAVYGNRIGPWAIRDVADGLRKRKIGLPQSDAIIVGRWLAAEYGF